MKRLEITTQVGEDKDSHVFELSPSGGFLGLQSDECKLEYKLDTLMGGGILGNLSQAATRKMCCGLIKPCICCGSWWRRSSLGSCWPQTSNQA